MLATVACLLLSACTEKTSSSARPAPEITRPTSPDLLDPAVRRLVDAHVRLAERDPENPARRGRLGLVYEANDLRPEARAAYAAAAALAPDDPLWLYHLAVVEQDSGRIDEARRLLEALTAERPDFAPAQQRLGLLRLESGDLDGALAAFRRVVALEPERPEGHVGAGDALLRAGHAAAAVEHLERAVDLDPENRGARYRLGLAYRDLGRPEAGGLLAVGGDPTPPLLPDPLSREMAELAVTLPDLVAKAESLRRAGRLEEATEVLESALADHPGDLTLLNDLATSYLNEGDLRRAREALDRALASGGNFETDLGLAELALAEDRPQDALSYLDRALERGPDLASSRIARAQVLVQLGRHRDAVADMEAALRLENRDPGIYLGLAVLYEASGRRGEATETYRRALQRWPDLAPAHLGLARMALARGDVEAAKTSLAAARRFASEGDRPAVADLERRLRDAEGMS